MFFCITWNSKGNRLKKL